MKVALVSTPSHEVSIPAPGIAYLKGVLNREGIESKCFDLNHDFLKKYGVEGTMWCERTGPIKPEYEQYFFDYCEKLVGYDWIGISLFSHNSQASTELLLKSIKDYGIESKIVLGGNGILKGEGFDDNIKGNFADKMLEMGLIDHYIVGEGDRAFPALLKGKPYQFAQMQDLSNLPYPDYSDFDLDSYGSNMVTITGSRGCVRKCTFCGIGQIWNKYKFRPGEEVAEEMIYQYKKHGVDLFYFSDSLVNGSLKEFRKFCRIMSEHNLPIQWVGQFIFRSGMMEEDWDYVKSSGCKSIWIGIESGSEKVRWHMKKKFDNRALYSSIKAAGERGIHMIYQTIVGYPTETEEEFQETLKMLERSAPYANNIKIRCHIAMLLAGTEMLENTDWHGENVHAWAVHLPDGQELDLKVRIERWVRVMELAKSLGMALDGQLDRVKREHIIKLERMDDDVDYLIEKVKNM